MEARIGQQHAAQKDGGGQQHAAQKDGGGQQHAGRDADGSCHVYAYHVPLVSHKVVKR